MSTSSKGNWPILPADLSLEGLVEWLRTQRDSRFFEHWPSWPEGAPDGLLAGQPASLYCRHCGALAPSVPLFAAIHVAVDGTGEFSDTEHRLTIPFHFCPKCEEVPISKTDKSHAIHVTLQLPELPPFLVGVEPATGIVQPYRRSSADVAV